MESRSALAGEPSPVIRSELDGMMMFSAPATSDFAVFVHMLTYLQHFLDQLSRIQHQVLQTAK